MSSLQIIVDSDTIQKMLSLGFFSFVLSMILTPVYTTLAYSGQWWRKATKRAAVTGEAAPIVSKQHKRLPTMAGAIFIISIAVVTIIGNWSRAETWLPVAAMVGAGGIGLLDDILKIRGIGARSMGLNALIKSVLLVAVAGVGGWWLYSKLGITDIYMPFIGSLHIGWAIMPIFIFVIYIMANAVNITDGLDGLAGGLSVFAFSAYAVIAIVEQRFKLAGFCLAATGALLSYTWFNIFPARFMMGDVGSFAIGTALGVVAVLTNTIFILPIIASLFLVEFGSSALQIASKKLRKGKKIFLSAPVHQHFVAIGWPETKVTMRFWVIGQIAAIVGVVLFILGGLP